MAENTTHNNMAKVAGVAAAAAAIGAATAMVLTPKTGREVREKIAEKTAHAKGKAEDIAEQAKADKPQ